MAQRPILYTRLFIGGVGTIQYFVEERQGDEGSEITTPTRSSEGGNPHQLEAQLIHDKEELSHYGLWIRAPPGSLHETG